MSDDKSLIESGTYPVTPGTDAVVGAQVKSITAQTEESVKALARKRAETALNLGDQSLSQIFTRFGTAILKGLKDIVQLVRDGGALIVSTAFGFINGLLGDFGRALKSLITPMREEIEAQKSGQLILNKRLDLVSDTDGYLCAYQSKNINIEWSSDNWRKVPFDAQLGPNKNAYISDAGDFILNAKGLWTINARVRAVGTTYTGGNFCYLKITILNPDGKTEYHTSIIETEVPYNRDHTLETFMPVVIPTAGYQVRIDVYSANWRWFRGGTQHSSLSAIRHSHDAVHMGTAEVSDETKPKGM